MFAEFGSIILLTLLFSRDATGIGPKCVLLGGFALLAASFAFVVLRLERSKRIAAVLLRREWYTVRPGCALLKPFDHCTRTDLPRGVIIRQGSDCFAVCAYFPAGCSHDLTSQQGSYRNST